MSDHQNDLRRLTVAQLKELCRQYNIPESAMQSRWTMVSLLRDAIIAESHKQPTPSPPGSRGSSPVPRLMDAVQEPPGNRVSPALSTIRKSARKSRQKKATPEFFLSKTLLVIISLVFAALILAQFV